MTIIREKYADRLLRKTPRLTFYFDKGKSPPEAELLREYEIQGYRVRGLEAVYQVVEHFGLHHGQILYITKMLRGEDLGFYRELKDSGRASGEKTGF